MIKNKVTDIIKQNLNVKNVELTDLTYQHRNHPKAHDGKHFALKIVSDDFKNIPIIERHRMIYKLLNQFIKKEIHALSISAKTISECNEKEASEN